MDKYETTRKSRVLLGVAFLVLLTAGYAEACPAIGVENNRVIIPDSHMSASSEFSPLRVASTARLNGPYGWEPFSNYDDTDNLVIDLGAVYNICAVATQGNGGKDGLGNGYQEWTKTYFLSFSVNSSGWFYYQEGGQNKKFTGNTDTNTVVNTTLLQPVLARFISFQPKGYETWKALRVEVYGEKVSELSHICPNDTCIYFTDQKNLRVLDVAARDYKTVVPNLGTGTAVDVLVRENTVFWSDTARDTIAKVNLTSGNVEDIVTGVNAAGIAVDWMARVIYWCDYNLETIEVAQLNGHNRKVLFNQDIMFPNDIAVDPASGYLFWSDSSVDKIYRSTLAGENRTVIVDTGNTGSYPQGIVLDYERRIIYWLDYWKEYIEGATYDGSDYNKLVKLSSQSFVDPFYVTILGDIFYWTDLTNDYIERVNKTSMTRLPNVFGKIRNVRGITAAEISRQPLGSNACSLNNGNCSHLCLLSTGGNRKCFCPSGKSLSSDGLMCQGLTDFFIVTEPARSAMKKVWIDTTFASYAFNPSHAFNPIGITCDAANKRVYWTDNYRQAVYMTDFKATLSVEVASNVRGYSRVAFDSTARNLYITEDVKDKIVIANLVKNTTRKKTIATVKNPQSIALDVQAGYMYISSCPAGANHTIVKADMDGNNSYVLVTVGASQPVGLVIDKANNRLYWVEEITKKIRYVLLNHVSQILTLQTLNFTVNHLAMTDILNYLYIVESGSWWGRGAVYRVGKTTGYVTKIVSDLWLPRDICGYSPNASLSPAVGACTNNNGGCGDAFCVTKPSDKTCMCPDGNKLVGSTCQKYIDHIFLAETLRISKLFSEQASSKVNLPLSYIDKPNALAYDEENGYIYWTDDYYSDINRAKLDGNRQSQLMRNVEKPDSLALDTIAHVMYWVDSANDVVEVARMDGTYRTTLLANISTPKSIALDLPNKYIYVAAWSSLNHTIIRADLDGKDRRVIATIGQTYPNGLVLDSEANRLCWVNERAKQITCLSLSTFKVTMLANVPNAVTLTGMTLQGGYLWVTDKANSSQKGSVYQCSKSSGTCTSFLTDQRTPRGIVANSTVYKGYSPCMDNKGNCSHLCVQSRQSQGHTCLCPNGMVLSNGTEKSCFFKEFLLVVEHRHFYGYGLLVKVPLNVKNPQVSSVSISAQAPVAVDYDYQDQKVYWSDIHLGTISRAFLNGSNHDVVVSGLSSPQGLAVDGIARNLYFSDKNRNTLEVVNINGSFRRILFNVTKPYDIALDTWEAVLYFSSCGVRPSLEVASMTGQERKILQQWSSHSTHCPHGLHYDRGTQRLYFTDGGFNAAYYITTNTRIVTELSHLPSLWNPFGLSMDEKYFYLTNNNFFDQYIYKVDKHTGTKVATLYRSGYANLGDIHVYKNVTPPANRHPCNLGTSGCTHLCLPHQYGYRCECPTMPPVVNCSAYDMVNLPPTPPPPVYPCASSPCMDGGTCIEVNTTSGVDFVCNCSAEHTGRRCQLYTGEKPPMLYFANEKKVEVLVIGSTNITTVVSGLDLVVAIDVDVKRNLLFFSDWTAEKIYRKNLTSGALDAIITNGAVSVEGIAFDWEACNIYWTDYILETVEVASCDGKYRKVLFREGVANARGIAVDPRKGYFFWSDWGTYKIERATLAGEERKVIVNLVQHGSLVTNGLLIDYENNRLYGIDSYMDQVWTCDFHGGYMTFVTALNPTQNVRPFDLALYDRTIYWSETTRETIHRYDIKLNTNQPNIYGKVGYVLGLAVDHHTRQPRGSQACAVNNGGCSQLCLLTHKGRKCACATRFKLAADNLSCLEITSKLLVTEPGRSQILMILRDEVHSMATIPVNPKATVYDPAAIAYDPLNKRMCWTDAMRYNIYCSFANGSFAEAVVGGTKSAEQLAIDWSGDKLYWTASAFNKIEVSTISGKHRMALITENLNSPHGITLDLTNRYIYFTTWANSNHKIERSDMDGGNRLMLASFGPNKPTSLNLEDSTNRLYWMEEATKNVRYIDLSSPTYDVHTLLTFTYHNTYQLRMSVDGPYVFLVNSGWSWFHFGGVYRCNKTRNGGCERVMKDLVDPKDIVAFNSSYTPEPVTTECSANNGGCQQLCLPKHNGYRCACSDTSLLNPDNKTCKLLVDFLVFAEYGSGRLTKLYPEKQQVQSTLAISYLQMPEAVAFDPVRLEIYWSDVQFENLNKATLDGKQRVIARDAHAAGIAIDVVTGNVYWTNVKQGMIEVATYNGTNRATLLSDTLYPKGIVLDLINKYVYWGSTSHSAKHTIERADMDGKNRITVASVGNVSPYGLLLHSDGNRICWVEEFERRIRCATPTSSISVLVEKLTDTVHPADITTLAGFWYITDIGPAGVIHKCNETKCEKFLTGLKSVKGIVSNANVATGESNCTVNNGGCSHICLQSRSSQGRTCKCPRGMVHNGTNSCFYKEFMLVAVFQWGYRSDLHWIPLATSVPLTKIPISKSIQHVTAVAFDQQDEKVYWADVGWEKGIYRALFNGSNVEAILTSELVLPMSLTVDIIARNIYWLDASANKIEVCAFDECTRTRKTLFNIKKAQSLVIDTFSGYMFFSSCGTRTTVEKAWLDGTNREAVKSWSALSRHCITELAFDRIGNKLIWIDKRYSSIEVMDLSTYQIQRYGALAAKHPNVLAMDEAYIYWGDPYLSGIFKGYKNTGTYAEELAVNIYGVQDIHVFKNVTLPKDTHPCTDKAISNCSDLCLLNPEGYHCACADSSVGCNSTTVKITTTPLPTTTPPTTTAAPTTTETPITTTNPCEPNPCQSGGTCEQNNDVMLCSCPEGYMGYVCETYFGLDEVEVSIEEDLSNWNETVFLESVAEICNIPSGDLEAKRRRRSASNSVVVRPQDVKIVKPPEQKGKFLELTIVVIIPSQNGNNKTVFTKSKLQTIIATHAVILGKKIGAKIGKIDGKRPSDYEEYGSSDETSKAGRNAAIVTVVLLIMIVTVVLLYLYMTRWRKAPKKLMRNESIRSITDFNNPGYMAEEETTRSRDTNSKPLQMSMINSDGSGFQNPIYGKMPLPPPRPQPYQASEVESSSQPRPPMRKLPLHESLASPLNESPEDPGDYKKSTDIDNNTAVSDQNVYVDLRAEKPNEYATLDAKNRDSKYSTATLYLDEQPDETDT